MEWAGLSFEAMLGVASAGSFLCGCLLAYIVCSPKKRRHQSEDPRNHKIRELEADLRTIRRQYEDAKERLEVLSEENEVGTATVCDLNAVLAEREEQVSTLKKEVKSAVAKTRELRHELTDRAAESIREHVRAEEVQTELDVIRAGSDAVINEFNLLQEERERLTGRMQELEKELLSEQEMLTPKG